MIHRGTLLFFIFFMMLGAGCDCPSLNRATVQQDADSLYTCEHIKHISITEPQKALELLDEAERRKLFSPFYQNYLRCAVYQNGLQMFKVALNYALRAWQDADGKKDPDVFLNLTELIVDQYYNNGKYTESLRYAIEGIEYARQQDSVSSEANLLLYIGLNKREMKARKEAYSYLDRSIALLEQIAEKETTWRALIDLVYAYGVKISVLQEDGEYKEAIAMLPRYEQLMRKLETCSDAPAGACDMYYASEYATYACIFFSNGESAKAREYYEKFLAMDCTHIPNGVSMKIDYLLLTRQYREALSLLKEEKALFHERVDTVSHDYINNHLAYEAEAYSGLGDYRSAFRTQVVMLALTDSLQRREKQAAVLELATVYETREKETLLQQQAASLTVRNVLLASATVVMLLLVFLLWRTLRTSRIIRQKNKVMARNLKEQMVYKEEALQARSRVYALTELLNRTNPDAAATVCPDREEGGESKDIGRIAFEQLDYLVRTEKLYLVPDISRDDLARRIHVDKNKFSQILQKYSGVKFYEYINDMRVEYAMQLMGRYPGHTFEAIAADAGFSSRSTFHVQFKRKTGMTPSEYRAQMEENM
ncbi:helix-turn-helix domain-containing protein [Phocaeicola sp.]